MPIAPPGLRYESARQHGDDDDEKPTGACGGSLRGVGLGADELGVREELGEPAGSGRGRRVVTLCFVSDRVVYQYKLGAFSSTRTPRYNTSDPL